MMRNFHRWVGLVLSLVLFVAALSGTALSVVNVLEAGRAIRPASTQTVADLAARVQVAHPGLEQIRRAPSGQVSAWWFDGGQPGSAVVDPATGRDFSSADPDPVRRWFTEVHRSFFLGDSGRIVAASGAFAMLLLAVSGTILAVRRLGGWKRWIARLRGPLAGRLHTEIARVAVVGLVLSAVTALWMSAETFEILSIDEASIGAAPSPSGRTGFPLREMEALRALPASSLRELSFPAADDPQDVYVLKTDRGVGYVDQGSGKLLGWQGLGFWQRVSETVYILHTAQGAPVLGIFLGAMALGAAVLSATGVLVWLAGWRNRPRIPANAPAARADTVVMVGSENGSTWGFAATLASALRSAGHRVHVAPMSAFHPSRYPHAQRYLILAATYGDGDAPSSAKGFLGRLGELRVPPSAPVAVLGFGDRGFPSFCGYAHDVDAQIRAIGWRCLLPLDTVDRQSPQDFARWGHLLGDVLGIDLQLVHKPVLSATEALTLLERRDYAPSSDGAVSILRFAVPSVPYSRRIGKRCFERFKPGDLLGVVPEGSSIPRFYSLASSHRDGFIEIVVRRHPHGLASGQLSRMEPGQRIQAFLRRHSAFHADRGHSPLILIGAGAGVGPLAGFIRNNAPRRPVHLFFGLRHSDGDFLYRDEFSDWQAEGKLSHLAIAESRGARPQYVQDLLLEHAHRITSTIGQGGRIMVCGGRDMARGVHGVLTEILQPMGLTPAALKAGGRYVEDVY